MVNKMKKIGTPIHELPPDKGNPRNSEGAFLRLADGRLMFAYSRYHGDSWSDFAGCDIAAIFYDGKSWSEPKILFSATEFDTKNIMSVSLLRLAENDIALFFLIRDPKDGKSDIRAHISHSLDEGTTWSHPVCCIADPGYNVTNNDRVIQLKNGRLLIPCSLHKNYASDQKFNSRGSVRFVCSDDLGETWRKLGGIYDSESRFDEAGYQEPGVIELEDGRLFCWSRTDMGRQYEMLSSDGGETWTSPKPSIFTGPCSPLSMKRLPDGRLFSVYNPIPNYNTRTCSKAGWGRMPLVGAFVNQDVTKIEQTFLIEDDAEAGYCYCAIYPEADRMFLAYCCGDARDESCLRRLRLTEIFYGELN